MSGTEQDLIEAAARLEAAAPGYLETVRRATARLATRPGGGAAARVALDCLQDVSQVDVDVPTTSRRRTVATVKRGVKAATGWYMRYLGQQVADVGHAVAGLGEALVNRTDALEAESAKARADLDGLAARVERLEQGRR